MGSPGELDNAGVREPPPKKARGPLHPSSRTPGPRHSPLGSPRPRRPRGGDASTSSGLASNSSAQCPLQGQPGSLGARRELPPPARCSQHLLWADSRQPGSEHEAVPSPGSHTPSAHARPTLKRVPLAPSPPPLSTGFFLSQLLSPLTQRSADFFCKEPDSKVFRFCGFCHDYSTQLLEQKSCRGGNEWAWLT